MSCINKVNKLCKDILKLTEENFNELEKMFSEQKSYVHPLKMGKAARLHDMGNHNQKVVASLKKLHSVIKQGNPNK